MQGKLLHEMKCSVKEQTCEECCANWSHCVESVRVPATCRWQTWHNRCLSQ